MIEDAFSKYHPAVNLLFFVGAVCLSALIQHPVYLLTGAIAAAAYHLLLNGSKGLKMIIAMLPLFLFITAFNPVVNTRGDTVLFLLFGRPYTLEALIYGVAVASIFVAMMLWLSCYSRVLTGDKLSCLLSNIIPSISLLLVMVLRMIPNLIGKAKQIIGVRNCVGKGFENKATATERIAAGTTVIGILTSWALEGSVVTGDSMRARGYGSSKRTSFMIYRMTCRDYILLVVILSLLIIISVCAAKGCMHAEFLPERNIVSIRGLNLIGFAAYLMFMIIPTALHLKEKIQWSISRYRI